MGNMDGWDVTLLIVAGYVATMALVRLMMRRRDQLVEQFQEGVKKERKRREAQRKKEQARENRVA